VGAATLVAQKENSLAVAGAKAAGVTGLIIVTIAACCSAASAINSTLFSVSRLARAAAEQRFVPACFGYCNRRNCPHWSVMFLGLAATVLASIGTLETLVQAGSLAFLLLFGFVNALAFCEAERRRWLPLAAALTALAAAIVVARELAMAHPLVLGGFLAAGVLCALAFFSFRQWRRRQRRAHAT
jgi:amino acid transporter